MKVCGRQLGCVCLSLLAGLCLASRPAAGRAAEIGYVNNLKMAVNMESVTVIGKRAYRDTPLRINPGHVCWHKMVPAGVRLIYLYDAAMPSRLLGKAQFPVRHPAQKMFFSLQLVKPPQGPPRPQLVPAEPPAKP